MATLEGQETNPNAAIFGEMRQAAEGQEVVETEAPVVEEPDEEEAPKAAKYRIAGREFATQEEAFAYAEDLDRQNAIKEAEVNAYRQMNSTYNNGGQQAQKVTLPPEEEDDFDAKFYENPKKYLQEREELVRQRTRDEVLQAVGAQSEEEKLWNEFFQENPDLSGDRDIAELVVSQHTEDIRAIAQTRGKKAASEFLAQKVRARHQNWVEAQKPRRELANTRAGVSVGSAKSVTLKQAEESTLSFAEQLSTINKY